MLLPRFLSRLCCGVLCAACLPPAAFAEVAQETEVKAAVVFNLLTFIQWPKDEQPAGRSLYLCTFEESGIERELSRHSGKPVHGRALFVRRIGGSAEELEQCQAVFVESANPSALARAAATARGRALLVVGEGAWALERGAMISVSLVSGRVAIDVDIAALRRSHLAASSKLLRLARTLVE
ncbi:MAG: YfiR family protein [Candidatus Nitricoxidivorans perseverans]|uniref:YfiR family protein n=1 Tax=Candidatus Nitricoxidivorans perseverans TaxID=2975601 RepID=A0AA49FK49_9PROT|nr:MAG: YfiR family protein [Candidatus Nitricoxidivorans perseverans]